MLDVAGIGDEQELLASVSTASFVRITAPARFVDAAKLASLLSYFNKLGEALAYSTSHGEITAAVLALEQLKAASKPKSSQYAEIERKIKDARDPAQIARSKGLYQDPTFLESLRLVTEFGYSDQLEVQQKVLNLTFSACLKREALRESESLIMRKYSRKTEKSLVVLGVVTQTAGEKLPGLADEFTAGSMKEALNNMIEHVAAMETSLSGKSPMEVVIDPIAVYASL